MKKNYKILIITIVTTLLGTISILPLLDNEGTVDWFGPNLYKGILINFWIGYFILFLLIGLILKVFKVNIQEKSFFRSFVYCLFTILLIVGYGITSHNQDYHNWQLRSKQKSKERRNKKVQLFNKKVDSLAFEINKNPKNSKAFFELGLTYRRNGNWKKSTINYNHAIKIDSMIADYHSELGYNNKIMKNLDLAIKHYTKALELDPSNDWIKSEIKICENLKSKKNR